MIPSFALPNTKFQSAFKANPLYPSTTEFDFILCFRYYANGVIATLSKSPIVIHGSADTLAEGKLASTGVL